MRVAVIATIMFAARGIASAQQRVIPILTALIAAAIVLLCSFPAITSAQSVSSAVASIYRGSANVPTNIPGVYRYPAPPDDFDALGATDEERASYGFPPRPDVRTDPDGYVKWTRAMKVAKVRWTGNLKDMGIASVPGMPARSPLEAAPNISAHPGKVYYYNWSGVANTNSNRVWSDKTSFDIVYSDFNVPVAQQPFGSCDGGADIEVSWNGIDGFVNGDVLQGGSMSQAYCNNGSRTNSYCGWVEWYPSYQILCQFDVNPGDDMYVVTYNVTGGGTNPGNVYIEDLTLQTASSVQLTWIKGPGLVGNSADYIVERPCCSGSKFYPLANYLQNFWASSYSGTPQGNYYAGGQASITYLINMVDDADDQIISFPKAGSAGEGLYSVFFQDDNCAMSGGCAQ
jgi:hypothetical protein